MGVSSGEDAYTIPQLARWLHSVPHYNVSFKQVDSTFNLHSAVYLESLGIFGSIPAATLILILLFLLIYLLTRCCDRKPRPSRSIAALKVALAILSVLCCAAVGIGLYGNDDLHNALTQLLQEGREIDKLVSKTRNHTESIERQLRVQAGGQLNTLRSLFDATSNNVTLSKRALDQLDFMADNNSKAANAAADIRNPLMGINLAPTIRKGERIEYVRWPFTMIILSVLLVLCVILLIGVARHNRCALIVFSVCGLLAVIVSFLLASIYIASSVALGDLCMAPDKVIDDEVHSEVLKEILPYYTSCESARLNPFTQRLREAKIYVENMRISLNTFKPLASYVIPSKIRNDNHLDTKVNTLKIDIYAADKLFDSLTTLVDCKILYTHYVRGVKVLCNTGLVGLTLMLVSAVLAAFLLTALVWVDSHTWIYIRKKKDYHQVNETDPYLPPPAASQAIAARTLQRSQGSSYPPDTPPPSYTSAMMHSRPNAPPHEDTLLLAACKEFPNFKSFKFDQQPQQQRQSSATQSHEAMINNGPRTANIQKFSSLGRRPLPQTPDEKARKQPPVPKVPTTISQNIETPLNPANFRSLQRGAWQDGTSTFQPGVQFRSLQRTLNPQPSSFRSAKIQDQAQNEAVYANSESERQLYAVTEL